MPGSCLCSGLKKGDVLLIGKSFIQDVFRLVPCAILHFAEMPGMTLAARKIASRLIDGKVVFRTRKMDGRDQSIDVAVLLLKGCLTRRHIVNAHLDQATAGG